MNIRKNFTLFVDLCQEGADLCFKDLGFAMVIYKNIA